MDVCCLYFRMIEISIGARKLAVPLLQVGSNGSHFPNELPAELKQCLAAFETETGRLQTT